jgi:hypothetical protein
MDIMKNESEKLRAMKWEAGESVSTKFQAVLKRNLDFSTITSVCHILNGDDVDPLEDISPEKVPCSSDIL